MMPLESVTVPLVMGAGGLVCGAVVGWHLARTRRHAPGRFARHLTSLVGARVGGTTEHDLRDLLAAATEHADELFSVVDANGRLAHANRAFCQALQYPVEELRARPATDCLGDQTRASFEEIDAVARQEGAWRGAVVRLRRDGTTFLTSCSVLALHDDRGELAYFIVVERDVTLDNQLREQLIHSERLAAVGQLVSGVAHELNNPLQSIIGFTELLIEAERRQEARSDLEHVRASAHRAAKIVRNLLAFVRRSAAERAPASLTEILQATVALRKYEFSLAGIDLVEEYAGDLPPVLVNREEIQQVILNLVLNAEQALKPLQRPGRLVIRTAVTPAGDVSFELEDNGPGVPATVAGRIFEPFFTTKGVGEGTGLGLSIAFGIAQAHGGTLELLASRSGGACFRLTLPKAPGHRAASPAASAPPPTWSAVHGRRALVADDEPGLRKLLHRLLTRRGFVVDLAEDGMEASALIEVHRYDVILCDVQMPRMTGPQLYESLRRTQPQLVSAFVMISGDVPRGSLQTLIAASQIPLLSKPFGAKNLDRVLSEVLARRAPVIDPPSPGHADSKAS